MTGEETTRWLKSNRFAKLNGVRARPIKHRLLPDIPMTVSRGQAEAVFLKADDGGDWILKKFHHGRLPDESYLKAVGCLLPRHGALESGNSRHVLSRRDLQRRWGDYFSNELARWVDKTILMRRVVGMDWATLADDLRDRKLHFDRDQRVTICRNLAQVVHVLESAGCAHRDISSGNAFIDTSAWRVILIDFDSVYHPSLSMPTATTCGTEGYTAPFVWNGQSVRPEATWCAQGDRFALAMMCVEFLTLNKDAPIGAEGGMFDQDQLRARCGTTLTFATDCLQTDFAQALPLFKAAINAHSCAACPAPKDWLNFCDSLGQFVKPPPLKTLDTATRDDFLSVLSRRMPAAPVWPAPRLSDIEIEPLQPLAKNHTVIPLPKDPWLQRRALSSSEDSAALASNLTLGKNHGSAKR